MNCLPPLPSLKRTVLALLVAQVAGAATDSFWTPVRWATHDQIRLVGLYHPASDPAKKLTWVLQHGLGSNKEEWDKFARQLATTTGQGVLIFDARGHGESQQTTGGEPVHYTAFARGDWQQMPGDMESAVDFLKKTYSLKADRIAVGGASLGANIAILYAAHAGDVPAVMLFSPGIEYAGMNIDNAFNRYGAKPLLLAASPGDRYAFESVQVLARRRGDAQLRVIEGPDSKHGVNMFDAPTTARILDWTQHLN